MTFSIRSRLDLTPLIAFVFIVFYLQTPGLASQKRESPPAPQTCGPQSESFTLASMDRPGTFETFCRVFFDDSEGKQDALVSKECSLGKKNCGALTLRTATHDPKNRGRILRRIQTEDLSGGKNPTHFFCSEKTNLGSTVVGASLEYWKIPETGSQIALCKVRDGSRISVDAL